MAILLQVLATLGHFSTGPQLWKLLMTPSSISEPCLVGCMRYHNWIFKDVIGTFDFNHAEIKASIDKSLSLH